MNASEIDADVQLINHLLTELRHDGSLGIHSLNRLREATGRLPASISAYLRELESEPETYPGARAEQLRRVEELILGLETLTATLVWIERHYY